jgi:hypothetical protein
VLALLACALPRVALGATPTAAEKETAREMMDSAFAQRDAGHHDAALSLFQGADAIMHVPTTGLEVARELMALGRLVEARDALQTVMRMRPADDEPEAFRLARKATMALDEGLVKRIPALSIRVAGSPTQVTVDGAPVPLAALVAPFKVDPGHHVVVATTATGEARLEVDVAEGETAPVDLVPLAAPSGPEKVAAAPAVAVTSDAGAGAHGASSAAFVPWLRWGGVGLAAVGVGVGAVTGIMAIEAKSSADKGCVNGMCPPSTWSDVDAARTTSTVSTIAFCTAGAGAVLVVVSYLIAPAAAADATATSTRASFAPWVGPGAGGVRGTF